MDQQLDKAARNRAAQARWRERHIGKRRNAQRIVNLLVRKHLTEEHVVQIAGLLFGFLNRQGVRTLRQRLKEMADPTDKDRKQNAAYWRAMEADWRDDWLREHPGRTRAEYNRLLRDQDSEVWEWRQAKGRAAIEAERQAWEHDHPGQQFPEHECALSEREYTHLGRWRRQRARRAKEAPAPRCSQRADASSPSPRAESAPRRAL